MKTLFVLLVAFISASPLAAADFPALEFPQGVGVNIHFTRGHARDLDMIAAAGFKFIRMDFGWGGIERRKGEYDWSAYDELSGDLEKRGLRAIYILDYSNGLYEDTIRATNPVTGREQRDTASPHQPESVAAFARWAAEAAKHFKGRRVIFEIWNEPNISFWKPKPNAQDYATLVLATCKAIRAVDPGATIIGPASSEFPWPFFEVLFKAGALDYLDAVSVHPYRNYSKGPETAAAEYLRLRALIERHAPEAKKAMPIISGEWGYASHTKGVSLETQAAFIARQQIANVWQRVPVSIWYDWKNDGPDPAYNENNFGTVSNNLALKPACVAVQTLTRELKGFHVARRLETQTNADFVFLLVNGAGDQKLVAWTAGKPHTISVGTDVAAGGFAAVNGQGQPLAMTAGKGNLTLQLQAAPQYITVKTPSRSWQAAAAWSVDHTPTLVHAGPGAKTEIPVSIKNPFSKQVRVSLISNEKVFGNELIAPGATVTRQATLSPTLRTADEVGYAIITEYKDADTGELISRTSESRHLVIANPLTVAVAPVQDGLRLVVDSLQGESFDGNAVIGSGDFVKRYPVKLSGDVPETIINASDAKTSNVTVSLTDPAGNPVTHPLTSSFKNIPLSGIRAALDGDPKVPATANVVEGQAPAENRPFARAYKLDYTFSAGWRFVQAVTSGGKPSIMADAKAFGVWVYGDKSGNALRMRITDSTGQTFQPGGPNLDWTGWRWVQFDLKNLAHAGHWGGANDGIPHGSFKLDSLLLVDGSRKETQGTIYFAGPAVVY